MRKVEHKLAFYPTSPIPNACREILEMGSHIRNTQINLVFHSVCTIFAAAKSVKEVNKVEIY